jgi:hypothetical protein
MNYRDPAKRRWAYPLMFTAMVLCLTAWPIHGQGKLAPPKLTSQVIWCFGDSLTHGDGGTSSYPFQLGERLPSALVINHGKSGEKAVDGVDRLKKLLAEKKNPNLVLLSEGANDRKAGTKTTEIQKALHLMIEMLKSKKIKVVLISQPDENNILGNPPVYYLGLGIIHKIPVADDILTGIYREAKVLQKPYLEKDGRHLTKEGNSVYSQRIFNFLKANGLVSELATIPTMPQTVTFLNKNKYDVRICVYKPNDPAKVIPYKTWVLKPGKATNWNGPPRGYHIKVFQTALIDKLVASRNNVTSGRNVTVSGSKISVGK